MPRDYKGGSRSGMYGLGASNRSERNRDTLDFYATPPIAVTRLLNKLAENDVNITLPHKIWEPAVGMGHIAKVLEDKGYEIVASDIEDRKWKNTIVENFLDTTECRGDSIITNPPYSLAPRFVVHAMDLLKEDQYCCMLLKIQFLEGQERAEILYKAGLNPEFIFVFPDRINCAKQGNFKGENKVFEEATKDWTDEEKAQLEKPESDKGGQIAYAWYIWRKGFRGMTRMDWL